MELLDTNWPIGVDTLKLEQQVFIRQAQIELQEVSQEALINATLNLLILNYRLQNMYNNVVSGEEQKS
jgi:hypothetical protein